MLVNFFPFHYFPSFTQSLALFSPSALFGSSVHILHFCCLLWTFHSSFSLTSFFFQLMHSVCYLVFTRHLRLPILSHSLTSHILSAANLAISVPFPFTPSHTHQSCTPFACCILIAHCTLVTYISYHTYHLRHIHCSMHASQFMDVFT